MKNFTSKRILPFALLIIQSVILSAIDTTMMDGPYIRYDEDEVFVSWVEAGEYHIDTIHKDDEYQFLREGFPSFSLQDLVIEEDNEVEVTGVEKFVALSDIHGQFDVFEKLLMAHDISDAEGNWTYGTGHLVIVGDVLDRGDEVIRILWYLYHLEQQAKAAGGRVHMLLGNHEVMVIGGNLGYLHKKYSYTSGISQTLYSAFFAEDTFWGRWLASKNVIKSINNIIFLHGGLSDVALESVNHYSDFNQIFKDKVLFKTKSELLSNDLTALLAFDNGPLWHRGLARPYQFDTERARKLLRMTESDHIVIGHTSMPRIMGLYDNRIILVDSSLKFGKSGELLFYENDSFYRGQMDGSKAELIAENEVKDRKSIQKSLSNESRPSLIIRIDSELKELKKLDELGLVSTYFDTYGLDFIGHVKCRMNKKSRQCSQYLFTAQIRPEQLKNFGFSDQNTIEIYLPCDEESSAEWFSQKATELDPSYQSKQVRLIIKDASGDNRDRQGLMVIKP